MDDDPSRAREPLGFVVSLAEAALTEMRALILALRPEALEDEGLVGVLREEGDTVALEVWDGGVGFDTGEAVAGQLGLRSMRERAERCGGDLAVESAPGRIVVRARIPAARR